jgi:hypothetical protein
MSEELPASTVDRLLEGPVQKLVDGGARPWVASLVDLAREPADDLLEEVVGPQGIEP